MTSNLITATKELLKQLENEQLSDFSTPLIEQVKLILDRADNGESPIPIHVVNCRNMSVSFGNDRVLIEGVVDVL